jgi:hypothetical protein
MEEQQKKVIFCKKLVYGVNFSDPTIILGVILEENDEFLKFKTAKHEYWINKKLIQSIEDTKTPFMEGEQ